MAKKIDPFVKEYNKLVGQTVAEVVVDDDDETYPVYGLRFASGHVAWILADPEGNGPGFLEIQE